MATNRNFKKKKEDPDRVDTALTVKAALKFRTLAWEHIQRICPEKASKALSTARTR
jgi:hypothetical protein